MNPKEAIRRLEVELNLILSSGFDQRKLVGRIDGVKIEIYPNEHVPPHFHIKSSEIKASFKIENCDLHEGYVNASTHKKIRDFHSKNKVLIIDTWNELRPTDCRVGPIPHQK